MTGLQQLLRSGGPREPQPRVRHQRLSPRVARSLTDPVDAPVTPARGLGEPILRLYLFGPVRAFVGDEVVIDEHFTRRKAKALLVLLYLERDRYISKEELVERLWPHLEEPPADSGRLKQTVLVLRRALEGRSSRQTGWRYILEHDGSYYFNAQVPYRTDLEDFEHELALATSNRQSGDIETALVHYRRAFALHRTELLPEFRYDSWAIGEIARVRDAYVQALGDAARLHGARGEYGRAVELSRRAMREDPLRESSAMELMEWLLRNGDPAEAVRVYHRLRDTLASQLQLEPDPKLTALYEAIRGRRGHGETGLSAVS
jgi:LuxR family transcriptional regulator, maltose regulon positive regulatory protein